MNHLEKFRNIHTFIFDVDGVLTDCTILVTDDGNLLRTMNMRDGYAIKRAANAGYRICIITGGTSEGVRIRLEGLGAGDIYMGRQEKLETYEELVEKYDLDEEGILYMGDDIPDYPVMRRVGLPACPADAAPEIMSVAKYISACRGGHGCVREVIEKVMRLQGQWETGAQLPIP